MATLSPPPSLSPVQVQTALQANGRQTSPDDGDNQL